jgi:hypothetical protein
MLSSLGRSFGGRRAGCPGIDENRIVVRPEPAAGIAAAFDLQDFGRPAGSSFDDATSSPPRLEGAGWRMPHRAETAHCGAVQVHLSPIELPKLHITDIDLRPSRVAAHQYAYG